MKKKEWSDYTEKEIFDNKKKLCEKCKYRGSLGAVTVCMYILINKKSRGCSPMGCKKFEKGNAIRLDGETD